MKKTKSTINGMLSIILIILFLNLISSSQIGISPAKINFKNVLRGGYSERTIIISTDSTKKIPVKITPRGEIMQWLNFSATKFNVSKNSPYLLKISVSPPSDMPNGNYTGYLRVEMDQSTGTIEENKATSIVLPVIDLFINIEITDQEYFECIASNFKVNSTEQGEDIVFSEKIKNLGNTRIHPQIKIDIWDSNQIEILKSQTFTSEEIKPTTEKQINLKMSSKGLKIGQYWAEVSVMDCYASQLLTFDILETGALRADGILNSIVSNPWITAGDTSLIEAMFTNTGEKEVEARFKGKIIFGDKTTQILESEKTNVPIGKSTQFQFYFTPKKPGRYIISGRVFYDNKKTFEKATIVNVKSSHFNWKNFLKESIYIILIIGIIYLIYKIKKEKTIYKTKIKRLTK